MKFLHFFESLEQNDDYYLVFQNIKAKIFTLILWSVASLIGLTVIWLFAGNFLVAEQEKKIEESRREFIKQFSPSESNYTALKIQDLAEKIGIEKIIITKQSSKIFSPYQEQNQSYLKIREQLNNYLEVQLKKTNNEVDIPPEKLRRYLNSQQENLENLRNYMLTHEKPRWQLEENLLTNINESGINLQSIIDLQQVLALEILEKNRSQQTKEMLQTLEISWVINRSLMERPDLNSQIYALIVARMQAGVMRKIDGLSSQWQERLEDFAKQEYPQGFLKALNREIFLRTNLIKNNFWQTLEGRKILKTDFSDTSDREKEAWLQTAYKVNILLKPYFRFAAVDYWQNMQIIFEQLPKQDICAFNADQFIKQTDAAVAAWNVPGQISQLSWVKIWHHVDHLILDLELTQKIIKLKELAAKNRNWPENVPEISPSICKNAQWIYKISNDGTISLNYSQKPNWLEENKGLPLSYNIKDNFKENTKANMKNNKKPRSAR